MQVVNSGSHTDNDTLNECHCEVMAWIGQKLGAPAGMDRIIENALGNVS